MKSKVIRKYEKQIQDFREFKPGQFRFFKETKPRQISPYTAYYNKVGIGPFRTEVKVIGGIKGTAIVKE